MFWETRITFLSVLRWSGCSRNHQGWSQSPGRCPFCWGWWWEQGLFQNLSQSGDRKVKILSFLFLAKEKVLMFLKSPSWRTRCRWPEWPILWSGFRCRSRWQGDWFHQCWTNMEGANKINQSVSVTILQYYLTTPQEGSVSLTAWFCLEKNVQTFFFSKKKEGNFVFF